MSTQQLTATAAADLEVARRSRTDRAAILPIAGVVATGLALLGYPYVFTSSYAVDLGIIALTFAIAASGWNVLGGYTGQVSFGHALFFGGAAYTTVLVARAGVSPWVGIAAGALVGGLLSVTVGLPSFRLGGHYYSIATIAFAEIVAILVNNTSVLGGAEGYSVPLQSPSLASLQFSLRDKTPYYQVALALFAVTTVAVWLFVRGRVGFYVRSIRDDPAAAAAIGIPVRRYKLYAAAMSGAVTGVAGGFFAMYVLFVDPPSVLSLAISINIALIAVLGGSGRLAGPMVGAWVITALQQYTRTHFSSSGRSTDLLIYGLLIVVVAVAEPAGIVGFADRVRRAVRRRRLRSSPTGSRGGGRR